MGVPLVGCASYRLNLAVQADMGGFGPDLDLIQPLMLKLRTISQSAKLRNILLFSLILCITKAGLRPVIRQDTRWGSTFAKVNHYFQLLEHLDKNDDALKDFSPPAAATRLLCGLLKDLKKVESVAKVSNAQKSPCSTLVYRSMGFCQSSHSISDTSDNLLTYYLYCSGHEWLLFTALISKQRVCTCLEDIPADTRRKAALQPFCSPIAEEQNSSNERSDGEERSFVEQLQKRRCLQANEQRYELLSSMHPTSNVAERFFSTARITYGQERHSLQPITLEMILFLRQNCSCWDARTPFAAMLHVHRTSKSSRPRVYTTTDLDIGDVVGEYCGELSEFPALVEGQPDQAKKENSGYTLLYNAKSTTRSYVYGDALKCGSITQFISHACDPNEAFVEQQTRTHVKVLVKMIKDVKAGAQVENKAVWGYHQPHHQRLRLDTDYKWCQVGAIVDYWLPVLSICQPNMKDESSAQSRCP
ncbi:LOW QUALITY PROTEIN: Hypothetical protein PHPALM_13929 [Phytophthora palmivora]|uniref:SET domain-containing protein n=1 Tax=Phytophthora palmivora TaxID=4796 RepID=A0A2P4XW27_9STRA|nr:LOW QUALITY PROTEIN: Hypothetical protein PHPALM_13929 [Phytophthora palmivora]